VAPRELCGGGLYKHSLNVSKESTRWWFELPSKVCHRWQERSHSFWARNYYQNDTI